MGLRKVPITRRVEEQRVCEMLRTRTVVSPVKPAPRPLRLERIIFAVNSYGDRTGIARAGCAFAMIVFHVSSSLAGSWLLRLGAAAVAAVHFATPLTFSSAPTACRCANLRARSG